MKRLFLIPLLVALFFIAACAPKITSIQRKEAAILESEAQFANTLRDWPRAEALMAKAVALCPDNGGYWLNLGGVRRRIDDIPGARIAYEKSVKAYAAAYKANPQDPQPLLQQIFVYSLLGRPKDALKVLKRVQADHGTNLNVKNLSEGSLERMRQDPGFKAQAI